MEGNYYERPCNIVCKDYFNNFVSRSEWDPEPLEDFEQKSDMIWLRF